MLIILIGYISLLVERHMFEIFDPDRIGALEQPDIEALYRMLYDSDDHDPKLVDAFPYDENGKISRDAFIAHIKSNRAFIKPASKYQDRVRKALGGFIMWETLTSFRKRIFAEIDETSDSLDEAVDRILNSEFNKREAEKLEQEEKDRIEREEILAEAARMQEEMRLRQEEKEIEEKRRQNQLDDENVKLAWMSFEAVVLEFEASIFNKHETSLRKERRDEIFAAFDRAVDETESYWANKYSQEYRLVCPEGGMPVEEKEHRLIDLMATPEGPKEMDRVESLTLLALVRARIVKKRGEDDPMINSIDGITSSLQDSLDTIESASLFAKQISKWGESKKAKNGVSHFLLLVLRLFDLFYIVVA